MGETIRFGRGDGWGVCHGYGYGGGYGYGAGYSSGYGDGYSWDYDSGSGPAPWVEHHKGDEGDEQ